MNRAQRYAELIGCADAGALAAMLGTIAESWDDIVDDDVKISAERVSEAFRLALVDVPRNAAYQRHPVEVSTLLLHATINWQIANEFERQGDADGLEIAHILRYLGASVVAHLAFMEGGMERAVAAGVAAWRMTTKERLADYIAEHRTC